MTQLGKDTFVRSNQSGWGTSSDGQTWSTASGTVTVSIASNEGHATSVTALSFMQLGSSTSANAEALVRVKVSDTNVSAAGIILRATGSTTFYRARLNSNTSSQGVGIVKTVSGTSTNLFTGSFTVSTGTFYWCRFKVDGTQLYFKAWQDATAEPAAWSLSGTDSSITGAGGFGICINSLSSSSTFDFDNYYAIDYPYADNTTYTLVDSIADTLEQTESNTLTDVETPLNTVAVSDTTLQTQVDTSTTTVVDLSTDTLSTSDSIAFSNPGNIFNLPDVALSISETDAIVVTYVATDTVSELETFLSAFAYSVTDTLATNDGISSETSIPDSVSLLDVSTTTPVFVPIETLSLVDASTTTLVSLLSDTVTTSDTIVGVNTVGSSMVGLDTLTPTDTLSFVYIYALTDSIVSSDTISSVNALASYPFLGYDTFTRANSSGTWGTSTDSQTWSITTGTGTLALSSNEGTITGIGALNLIRLGSKTSADQEGIVRVSVSSTSFSAAGITLRQTATNTTYRIRLNSTTSSIGFSLVKTVSGTSTNIVSTTFAVSANTFYWIRAAVIGTNLYGKIWQDTTVEPAAWTLVTSDSSITGAGGFGLVAQSTTSTDTASFDNFFVVDYALGDYSVFSLDRIIESVTKSITETVTSTETNTETLVVRSTDTLTSSDSLTSVETFVTTETFSLTEVRLFALAVSVSDTAPTFSELISTIAQSTISNISGTDTGVPDDSFSSFLEQFNPFDIQTSSDTITFNYTYNDPYAGSKVIASDTYNRSNQSGWGTASDGSTWSTGSGTLTYAIASNQGTVSGTSGEGFQFLGTESTIDGEAQLTFTLKNSGDFIGLALRVTDASNLYYTYYAGGVLYIAKKVAGTYTPIGSNNFVLTLATAYHLRFAVIGSALYSKIWQDTTVEPASWLVTTTDTSFTGSGKTGIEVFSSTSGTITVDNFLVIDYRLSDLTPITDATTLTGVNTEVDTFTEVETLSGAFQYFTTDIPTLFEVPLFIETLAFSFTATLSDSVLPTAVFVPTDTVTSVETALYGVAQLVTDILTTLDTSSLFLFVPTDVLSPVEEILETLAFAATNTETTSDSIFPTLVRELADVVLFAFELLLGVEAEIAGDTTLSDVLISVDTLIPTLVQQETNTFTFTEIFNKLTLLTLPFDSITEIELLKPTIIFDNENPTILGIDDSYSNFLLSETIPETLTIQEILEKLLSYAATDTIQFIIDASKTTVTQFDSTTLTNNESVSYILALIDTQIFSLVDASITAITQFKTDTNVIGTSTYKTIENFTPTDQGSITESLAEQLLYAASTQNTLIEQYLTTLFTARTDTLTVGTESVFEIVKFAILESLTASETLLSILSLTSTQSVQISEFGAFLLKQFESVTFTEIEAVAYALVLRSQDAAVPDEKLLSTLFVNDSTIHTLIEQVIYALTAFDRNTASFVETIAYALAFMLSTSDTVTERITTNFALSVTDSETLSEILQTALATRFTNWVDILTLAETFRTITTQFATDTLTNSESARYVLAQRITDILTGQELLISTLAYARTSAYTIIESLSTTLQFFIALQGSDTFTRSNVSGTWGTSSDGQAWGVPSGPGTLSIASNEGVLVSTNNDTNVILGTKKFLTDMEIVCRIAINNSNDVCGIQARFVFNAGISTYKLVYFGNSININKDVNAISNLASQPFTMAPGVFYWFKLRVIGTALSAKIWQSGTFEPDNWMLTTTDSAVTTGGFGVLANTDPSSTGVRFDHFTANTYSWGDLLTENETNATALLSHTTDTTVSADTIFKTIVNTFSDILTTLDVSTTKEIFTPIDVLATPVESMAKVGIFVPVDRLVVTDLLAMLLALSLVDVTLVPVELAPSLGYALFDVALITFDILSYSNYIFMNVLSLIRSGETNGIVRSGENLGNVRSGDIDGIVR
jgi:hypothetical protein